MLVKNSNPNRILKIFLWSLCKARQTSFETGHKIKKKKKNAAAVHALLVELSSNEELIKLAVTNGNHYKGFWQRDWDGMMKYLVY